MAPDNAWDDDREERRSDPRRAIRIDAHLEHPGGELHGLVVNISFGGAKFLTRIVTPELAIGTAVTLTIEADARQDLAESTWDGHIRRIERSGDDGPPRIAYAIEFEALS